MDMGFDAILPLAVALLVVGGLLYVVGFFLGKKPKALNKAVYREKWQAIQALADKGGDALPMAVLRADSLLDQALRDKGIPGKTMGERMKHAQKRWSNANSVWAAHKLRNRIAHETTVQLAPQMVQSALASFYRGLQDLGAV